MARRSAASQSISLSPGQASLAAAGSLSPSSV